MKLAVVAGPEVLFLAGGGDISEAPINIDTLLSGNGLKPISKKIRM